MCVPVAWLQGFLVYRVFCLAFLFCILLIETRILLIENNNPLISCVYRSIRPFIIPEMRCLYEPLQAGSDIGLGRTAYDKGLPLRSQFFLIVNTFND
jgi:hypothetical protein